MSITPTGRLTNIVMRISQSFIYQLMHNTVALKEY
jgi:hypothetical protein